MRAQSTLPLVLVVGVVVGAMAFGGEANRLAAPPRPTVIATVNLEEVFRGLNEYQSVNERLKALAAELDKEGTRRRDEITRLGDDINLLPAGPNRDNLERDWLRKSHDLQAYVEFATRKLNDAQSRALRDLYERIRGDIAALATSSGYDVVFVDDSVAVLPEVASEAEMMRQISARRILYAGKEIDITKQVVDAINARRAP